MDKRAAYECLAARAAHDLLARWRAALRPGMRIADRVVTGLRLAADFWRADRERARLRLEGGPSFGSEGHLRFVDEIASVLAAGSRGGRRPLPARALSLLVTGLGIELGRVIVARALPPIVRAQVVASPSVRHSASSHGRPILRHCQQGPIGLWELPTVTRRVCIVPSLDKRHSGCSAHQSLACASLEPSVSPRRS